MGRRRYINTDISTDPKLARLSKHGPLPLLLYTWAIPHMDDWGRMTGDPLEFKLMVCPALDVTPEQVNEALHQIADAGLWQLYQVDDKQYLAIEPEKWFKHQSYIPKSKRGGDSGSMIPAPPSAERQPREDAAGYSVDQRKTPQTAADQRRSAQNTASPSPSLSLIYLKHMSAPDGADECAEGNEAADGATSESLSVPAENRDTSRGAQQTSAGKDGYSPEFEEFWSVYPRRVEKKAAFRKWQTCLKAGASAADMIRAARNYAEDCRRRGTEKRFIKHASTFLGPDRPFLEWVNGPPEPSLPNRQPRSPNRFADKPEYARIQYI